MRVSDLIYELQQCDPNDDVVVKIQYPNEDKEYDISHVGTYYDWSYKEGGNSPAIICDYC